MFLVDTLTVYEEMARVCVCMVFFLSSLRQMLVNTMYIIEKKDKKIFCSLLYISVFVGKSILF